MSDPTDFLYPMVDADVRPVTSPDALLADLARSARDKVAESATTTTDARRGHAPTLAAVAAAIAARIARGGRIFTCGNGGSATDADGVAALFADPPTGIALPASSLVADVAVVTALANDIGFDAVFARQLMAHGTAADVVLGFSTSGNSANVLQTFHTGRRAGMLTIGFAGDRGGAMADSDDLDHLMVVRATSIHRIQEAQSALAHDLWQRVQAALDDPTVLAAARSRP